MDPVASTVPEAFQSRHSTAQDLSDSGWLCGRTVEVKAAEGAADDAGCLHSNASESPNLHVIVPPLLLRQRQQLSLA